MGRKAFIKKYSGRIRERLTQMGLTDEVQFKNSNRFHLVPVFHQEDLYEDLPITEKDKDGNESVSRVEKVLKASKGDLVMVKDPGSGLLRPKEERYIHQIAYNLQRNFLKRLLKLPAKQIEEFLATPLQNGDSNETVSVQGEQSNS